MIFPQYVIYVLIYDYLNFRKRSVITSQEIANYISVALAVALSVYNVINGNIFSFIKDIACIKELISLIIVDYDYYLSTTQRLQS